ncbi:MAG TPA: sigma-70 family RNA polymerase sigma factor [Thermoanaerobaculia bacterium]|nr:sigma-70 family RNA polymerase sigma factor [Thermoanaerobaculia bacterium]
MELRPTLEPNPGSKASGSSVVDPAGLGNRLVAAWQAGGDREEIFRRLFHAYFRQVHAFFSRRGFPADVCQDLAQETFLKVHKGLPEFRREARFETWLFQIAANLYRNTLRSQSTQKREAQEVPLDELGEQDPNFAQPSRDTGGLDEVLSEERSLVLYHALAELPSQMRRCVELRVHQDLRYREIADLMQVSIDTVKAHLYQARQQLKSKLAGYFADPEF